MSVSNICRLCALRFPISSLKTIQELKSEQFDSLIFQYLQIQLNENDAYPNSACKLCCKTLYDFDQFLVKVKVAQHKLYGVFTTNSTLSSSNIKEETQTIADLSASTLFPHEYQASENRNVKVENSDYGNNYDTMDHFLNDFTLNLDQTTVAKSETSNENNRKDNSETTKNDKPKANYGKILHWKCYKCNVRVRNAQCLEKHFNKIHNTEVEYVCTECNALFSDLPEFAGHYHGHGIIARPPATATRLKFSCEICGKQFAKSSNYKIHKNTHLGLKRFMCEFCGKKFTLKRHKEIHKLTVCLKANLKNSTNDSVNPEVNGLETAASSDTNARPISEQELKSKWKCDICSNKFYTAYILQNHLKNVHGIKNSEHICTVCDQIFENNPQYEDHLKTIHGILNKRTAGSNWKCDKCPKEFNHMSKYLRHTLIHTGVRRFGCKECGKKFYLKENLVGHSLTHRKSVNEHAVQCTKCSKMCKNQYILDRHLKTHIPIDERYIHKCDVCKRKFVSVDTLKTHQEQAHKYEDSFICDECGKIFKSKYRLAEHTNIHKNITFSCELCSKPFNSVTALKTHKLTHMEKSIECQVCGMKFRRTGQLTKHSTIHSGKRPHECTYCHKQFRQKYALKVHLRQHTGERPYSCTECNHFFANDGNFIKHLKGRHGLQNVSIANRHRYPFDN